jgi:cellulose biosynthesis protein BcsQ
MAVSSPWPADISVLAGSREVAALEGMPQEYGDVRLRHALAGWDRDVVIVDTPSRQGGFLIRAALTACRRVIYATTPGEDERVGVAWARSNVERFRRLSPLTPT